MSKKIEKKERRISHAGARKKGHAFERFVAHKFRDIGFIDCERQLEYQINQCKGVDLKNAGPFMVQCKKLAKYASINTINEIVVTETDRDFGQIPVLITAGDNLPPMAVLDLEDFLRLAKNWQK